jgi:hypothetical protein
LRPGSDPDHPVPSAAGVLPAPVSPPFPTITPHGRRSSYHPHPGRRTDALGSKKRADGSKEGGTAGPLTLLYTRQAPLGLRKRTQRAGPFRRGVIEPVRLVIWSIYPAAPDLNPAVNPTRTSATALRRRPAEVDAVVPSARRAALEGGTTAGREREDPVRPPFGQPPASP